MGFLSISDIKSFLSVIDDLLAYPFFYLTANILLSFFAACIAFPIIKILKIDNLDDIRKLNSFFNEEVTKKSKFRFIMYTGLYALLTGLMSAALIDLQLKSFSFSSSIAYGVMGPFFLKDKLASTFRTETHKNVGNEVKRVMKNLNTENDEALKDIGSKLNSALDREIKKETNVNLPTQNDNPNPN